MHPHLSLPQHWRSLAVGLAAVLSAATWTVYFVRSRHLTPAQMEERRRALLAADGRIIDGILIGAEPSLQAPEIVVYTYRVAGVQYECSQNIAALPLKAIHLDAPIQVRYSLHNPGNSIVVAENWNGLW